MRRSVRADLALLGVSFAWGATFPVMKLALDDASPMVYLCLRFTLALLFTAPLWPSLRGVVGGGEMGAGLLLGGLLAAGFVLQTVGLQSIEPARSAFLTSLYVIFVPLLSIPLLRRVPRPATWVGVGLALAGLTALSWDGAGLSLRGGDLMTVGAAACFALHIICVGLYTARHDYRRLFVLQIATATLILLPGLLLESRRLVPTAGLALALLITAGPATTLAFYVQNRVQRRTSPSRAAIIFALEPVFAALCTALLIAGLGFTSLDTAGAALILAGLVVAEARRRPAAGSHIT